MSRLPQLSSLNTEFSPEFLGGGGTNGTFSDCWEISERYATSFKAIAGAEGTAGAAGKGGAGVAAVILS